MQEVSGGARIHVHKAKKGLPGETNVNVQKKGSDAKNTACIFTESILSCMSLSLLLGSGER